MAEAAQLDDLDHWQKQWPGEAWQVKHGKWRATAWFLERSNPEAWAETHAVGCAGERLAPGSRRGLSPLQIAEEFELLVQHLAALMEEAQENNEEDEDEKGETKEA